MKKNTFWISSLVSVQLVLLMLSVINTGCSRALKSDINKPNIVFVFADDQSYEMIHAFGNEELKTPNLDKLALEGVTFTHAFNMGAWSGAVCVASRAMLNTGRFIWRAHETVADPELLVQSGNTWAQLMAKAGYDTYMTGKWHVKAPADSIFEFIGHIRPGMPNQTKEGYNRPKNETDTTWTPWNTDFGGYSIVDSLQQFPNLIIMKSMSKFPGMAGMRLGYALADEFLIARLKELLPAFNVNIASLELAKLVIQEKVALKNIVENIISERDTIYDRLTKLNGITPYKSFTNFIMFKIDDHSAADIQKALLKEKGVLVRNMSAMPLCENCLRVSITTEENNNVFLQSLEEIMQKFG